MSIVIKSSAVKKLQEEWRAKQEEKSNKINWLIYGDIGTGKTTTACTGVEPILYHSFDPGGLRTKIVQDKIQAGRVIPDESFEQEDWKKPVAFKKWEAAVNTLYKEDAFSEIGTYVLDFTRWCDAIMNQIQNLAGRPGKTPQLADYQTQQYLILDYLMKFCNLPCDFVLVGHSIGDKDEMISRIRMTLLSAGKEKHKVRINLMFDEIYAAVNPQGKYNLLTQPEGLYTEVRTRIGTGIFERKEVCDLQELRKKAGYPITLSQNNDSTETTKQ